MLFGESSAIDACLQPGELSLMEASGMIAYLIEAYGRDTVFANRDSDTDEPLSCELIDIRAEYENYFG